jgi:hypothetical protein
MYCRFINFEHNQLLYLVNWYKHLESLPFCCAKKWPPRKFLCLSMFFIFLSVALALAADHQVCKSHRLNGTTEATKKLQEGLILYLDGKQPADKAKQILGFYQVREALSLMHRTGVNTSLWQNLTEEEFRNRLHPSPQKLRLNTEH